jgi:imidazolonepropionase-like amidohydrolase
MVRLISLMLLCCIVLSPALVFCQDKLPATQLIYNARIIDVVEGKTRKEKAILIKGQTIAAIGDYARLSKGVPKQNQVDAGDRYLIPGLWDNHVHLEGQALVRDNEALLPLFLTYGITTIRDCASDLGLQVLKWRDSINAGRLVGPTIFTAGLKLEGKNSIWKGDLEIENETEMNQMLDKLDSLKVDFIKITENTLAGPLFLASIKEAHKRGYLVSGHVPLELTIEEMLDAGFSSVEHSSYLLRLGCDEKGIVEQLRAGKITRQEANKLYQTTFNQETADRNYARLAKKGLTVTPTLIGGRQLSFLDEDNHLQDSMMTTYLTKLYTDAYQWRIGRMANETAEQKADRKTRYRFGVSQVPHFQQAGIRIIAGSDEAALNTFVYPGESLVDELQIFQQAGLKPAEILRTATINGALFLRKADKTGSLEVGKTADLVILDADPLQDIKAVRQVYGVFSRGKYFDRAALDKILGDVRNVKQKLDAERATQ